jgi:4-hydroxy-2-oxoglutarate aldolase
MQEARRIQRILAPLAEAVTVDHGIAGLKAALDLRGSFGGEPRLPLLPAGEEARRRIASLLREAEQALV